MPHYHPYLTRSWSIICLLTVEPVLFLSSLGSGIYETTTKVLMYDKVCIMLLDDVDNCVARNLTKDAEILVQQRASMWEFYRTLTAYLPPVFLIVIYSNLVDRWSKKYTILLCPIGFIISSIVYLVCAVYMSSSPGYLLIGSTVLGLSGGILAMMGACFSYLSATASPSNLIIYLSIAEAALLASSAISSFVSGILQETFGAVVVYVICIVFNVLLILYVLIRLKNISLVPAYAQTNHEKPDREKLEERGGGNETISSQANNCFNSEKINNNVENSSLPGGEKSDSLEGAMHMAVNLECLDGSFKAKQNLATDTPSNNIDRQTAASGSTMPQNGTMHFENAADNYSADEEQNEGASDKADLVDNTVSSNKFFSVSKRAVLVSIVYLRDYVNIAARRRQHNKRRGILAILIMLFIAIPCIYAVWNGLCYLFVTQEPLSMSTATYGYLVGVLRGVKGVCLLVVLPVFKRLNVPYSVIIVISLVSSSFSAAFFSVSIYTWMAFVAAVLNIFETALIVTSRSLIVNFVEEDEHGKAFGMVASLESLSFVLSGAIFNLGIYPATVHIFSGIAILVAALLLLVPLSISVWLHFFMRYSSHLSMTSAEQVIVE